MERTFIRAWRRTQENRIWRNRIKYHANLNEGIFDSETRKERYPRDWKEYKSVKWMKQLKNTATVCSCALCKNERYNRRKNKQNTLLIIREQSED